MLQMLCSTILFARLCRSYTSNSTSFVVTYPVASGQDTREAALAWELAFVELAKGPLTDMAVAAGLSLSFSSER